MTPTDRMRRFQATFPERPTTEVVMDREDAYHDEWTASVANANVFILHMRHYYRQSKSPRNRAIYQLHVVQGLLYIVQLVQRIRQAVLEMRVAEQSDAQRILALGERWTLLSISNAADIAQVISIVTTGGWPNTYLKHVSALMYAINFFDIDDSSDFLQLILTADVLHPEVIGTYHRKTIPHRMWMSPQSPRPIAAWISERTCDDNAL